MKLLDQILSWFKRKTAIPPTPQPSLLAIEHKIASPRIVRGFVRITNDSDLPIELTGGPLRQIRIGARSWALVKSPILENVMKISGFSVGANGERAATSEIAFINEWDALHVVNNMIEEYARGRAYDIMTPEELRVCTLPLPGRALAELIDRIGVKAQRENENISAQA